jgi:short-subunit dehydrogenase
VIKFLGGIVNTVKIVLIAYVMFQACMAQGQRAIVIGASSGIGHEVAKVLASQGYDVGLASRRIEKLNEVQDEIKMLSPNSTTWVKQLDVTHDNAMTELEDFIVKMGGLDLIVISITSFGDSRGTSEQEVNQKCLDVELLGFWKMANCALQYFKKQGTGHVVGISSVDALRGNPYCPMYSAAKAFVSRYLEGISRTLPYVQNELN